MHKQDPVRGLILSGGGARGAYQVGVLAAIAEMVPRGAPNPFPIICGTSAGAINAALLATENYTLNFVDSGIEHIAQVAHDVNERTENIGARRLHTVMERLLEEISFEAADKTGLALTIDAEFVDKNLSELVKNEDLSRYIL